MKTKNNLDDATIIENLFKGRKEENEAISNLYDKNRQFFQSFIRRNSNIEHPKNAEDILWETIEVFVNNVKDNKFKLKDNISISSYLKKICKNLWLKHLGSEESRGNRQEVYSKSMDNSSVSISDIIIEKEKWDEYLNLFDSVGKNCKEILKLTFGESYSFSELSEKLIGEGKYSTLQAVRNAKSKCLKNVLNKIKDERFRNS